MQYFVIFLCFIVFIYSMNKYRHFYNPMSFFSAVWLIIVGLFALDLSDLNAVSEKVYGIVFVGILCFIIGAAIGQNVRFTIGNDGKKYKNIIDRYQLNYRTINILMCISLIVVFLQFSSALVMYISGMDMHDIRVIYATGDNAYGGGAFFSALRSYVVAPFIVAVMPIASIAAFYSTRRKISITILAALLIGMQILADGGRVALIQFLFCVIIVYILTMHTRKRIHISRKAKRRILVACLLGLGGLIILSQFRGIENDIWESFYTYVCGCLPYMDYRLKTVDSSNFYTYGWSALFGVMVPLQWVLSVFGIYIPFFSKVASVASVQETYFIGTKTEFNAFVSTFYHLYLDGRWIGVAIGMLLYGFLAGTCYRKLLADRNARNVYVYTLILLGLLFTMIRLPFVKDNYVIAMAMSLLLFKKSKGVREET